MAAHIGQRRGDEEIDMVAVDDERAYRRVRENGAGMMRRGMAVTSVGPMMTAPERPRGLFDGGPSAACRRLTGVGRAVWQGADCIVGPQVLSCGSHRAVPCAIGASGGRPPPSGERARP